MERVMVARSSLDRVIQEMNLEVNSNGKISQGGIGIGSYDPTVHGYATIIMGLASEPAKKFLAALGTSDAQQLLTRWEANASPQPAPVGA